MKFSLLNLRNLNPVSRLSEGTVFLWDNSLWMKCWMKDKDTETTNLTPIVALGTGHIKLIEPTTHVQVVQGRFVEEYPDEDLNTCPEGDD